MALPTIQDAREYLRVDLTTDQVLITNLLTRAKASIETLLGYALTAVAVTHVEYGRRCADSEIQLPGPFLASPAPVVTDVEGTVVDASTYVLDTRSGKIRSKYGGGIFTSSQYTVLATIGLSAHPDYAARLEAIAGTSILDLVSHLYENRNPAEEAESVVIPPRIQSGLMLLPCTRGLLVA